jgi:cell division protein ZapA (FtsZ GTPase activity inhibitor)
MDILPLATEIIPLLFGFALDDQPLKYQPLQLAQRILVCAKTMANLTQLPACVFAYRIIRANFAKKSSARLTIMTTVMIRNCLIGIKRKLTVLELQISFVHVPVANAIHQVRQVQQLAEHNRHLLQLFQLHLLFQLPVQ